MSTAKLAGLFVSATQTGYDVHAALTKMKAFKDLSIELVQPGSSSCEDSDIIICSSYTCLIAVKEYLNKDMVVIVCDGPLIVSCLTTATPIDFERRVSYKFEFRPVDYRGVLKATKVNGAVELLADSFDVLGMVTANSMSGGLILTEFNKVQSYFDALARNRLRFLFLNALNNAEVKPELIKLRDFLLTECTQEQHLEDAKSFFQKLVKGGAIIKLRACMKELNEGKSITTVVKKHDIELFELNYIRKMARTLDGASARTATYAHRTANMLAPAAR